MAVALGQGLEMIDHATANERLQEARSVGARFHEQGAKVMGWMNASLLIVNGGAAASTIQAVDKLVDPKSALIAFGFGILSAIGSAICAAIFLISLTIGADEVQEYWRTAGKVGFYDPRKHPIDGVRANWKWPMRLMMWCAALSWFSFLAGGYWLVYDSLPHAKRVETPSQPSLGRAYPFDRAITRGEPNAITPATVS